MPSAFIHDGYTREALINGSTEFDPFTIEFRPMLRQERNRLLFGTHKARDTGNDDQLRYWEQATIDSIAERIRRWDLKDAAGRPVKISADNLGKLHPDAFEQIYAVVAGYSEPKAADADAESAEEADAKNS